MSEKHEIAESDTDQATTLQFRHPVLFAVYGAHAARGDQTVAEAQSHANARRPAKPTERTTNVNGNYAEVNGLKMYYEVQGAGKPLVRVTRDLQ